MEKTLKWMGGGKDTTDKSQIYYRIENPDSNKFILLFLYLDNSTIVIIPSKSSSLTDLKNSTNLSFSSCDVNA
ncbi:MAG: hypothetical protein O8C58_05810 [Candidatus Methanoperedens sp.]|nr:hypothetical protein [Candidatus Methanoperedens sp.]